ncbi:MAG: MarR family winged helix-turn-helix transcriptional regulator [Streptosporangiaceae bacterium]
MPARPPDPADRPGTAGAPGPGDVVELERALTRIAYLLTRIKRHDQIRIAAGVPVDRAAVVILRHLAESGGMRPGELAAQLEVEPPHITRQLQRLAKAGYVDRVPDPGDRRAQLIRLTPAGQQAADRIRAVGRQAMQAALASWTPEDVHQLATLFHRMVDDFLAYADAAAGPGAGAGAGATVGAGAGATVGAGAGTAPAAGGKGGPERPAGCSAR